MNPYQRLIYFASVSDRIHVGFPSHFIRHKAELWIPEGLSLVITALHADTVHVVLTFL